MDGWVDRWVIGYMGYWLDRWMGGWVDGWVVDEWMHWIRWMDM